MSVIGFDTSNYTTSVAVFQGASGENYSQLLPVPAGQLGLRQSEALFAHVKGLPGLADRLFSRLDPASIAAIGVSSRPRAVEGSYMPCFLAGVSQARVLAAALRVPVVEVSHQQGHIAAALWSADRLDLLSKPHLAWHLSGGTTELLFVKPDGWNVACTRIGGTTDISAGQLIDRTGQLLGLSFPAGKALDALAAQAQGDDVFSVKCLDMEFSLSGVENKVRTYLERTGSPAETAGFALRCVVQAVRLATAHARVAYPGLSVLFSGGVSSNSLLRRSMEGTDSIFCQPVYATDNAMGVAVLTWRSLGE